MTQEDCRNAFGVAMAALRAEFGTCLVRDGADPMEDPAQTVRAVGCD